MTIDVAKYTAEDSSSDTIISTSMLWIITVIFVALIVVLFSAFAPSKIKIVILRFQSSSVGYVKLPL